MKTTTEPTNDLRHVIRCKTAAGNDMTIAIRLNDERKNGHADFAITGDIYQANKPRNDKYYLAGGCIHDEILKARPDLKIFVDLHLSDSKGVPMYAIENGYYHLRQSTKEVAQEYLRATDQEIETLLNCGDKLHFAGLLFELGIVDRWKSEAQQAIKLLEEMTGGTFTDPSTRGNIEPLTTEAKTELRQRLENGYYTPEAIAERAKQAEIDKHNKTIAKVIAKRDEEIKKATDECNVKLAVLNAGMNLDNFIYYNHSNEGAFNWLDYQGEVTAEQFEKFLQTVDMNGLPEGIKFKLK